MVDLTSSVDVILEARDLCKSYSEGQLQTTVLQGVNFQAKQGETIAIIGASGSGKSTLMHLLGGLDTVEEGEVLLAGQALSQMSGNDRGMLRNKHLGFVYQFHHLLGEFSAVENVSMPLRIRGVSAAHAQEQAREVLKTVGLEHRFEHRPGELSGGERQRVAIARAVVTKPSCVLADEPTGNLDRKTADSVFETLMKLNEEYGMCVVMVTHDTVLAQRMEIQMELVDGVLGI
ncbi:MAG: lipoprotein-releasing ABC transporter ATP-binding protein LolD [Arenicella sp.]